MNKKRKYCDLCGMTYKHWAGCTLDPKNWTGDDAEIVARRRDGSPIHRAEQRFQQQRASR